MDVKLDTFLNQNYTITNPIPNIKYSEKIKLTE